MNRVTSTAVLLLAILFVLVAGGCVGPHRGGPMQAHKDLSKGKWELRSSGIAYPPRVYSRFLWDKVGVRVHIYRGKLPKDPDKSIYGYNDVVIAALEGKYGKGVMEKLDDEFNYVMNRDYVPLPKGMKRLEMSSYFMRKDTPKRLPKFVDVSQ
ncbi:hypothetical protein KS4_00970 [Poriferisphaera corsica]|uniref:Lipoprotein n=1 Tax=Poriferisphaera corsica TaxID=2528020 RepID=A0A517YPB7_9BACT|nr:hypothetical protein [Poriferisphaera corsica]QDU32068.1 hypothetical protein KS4_00970 [Poriferisphaera corsica]